MADSMVGLGVPLSGLDRAASDLHLAARKIASIGSAPLGDMVDLSAESVAMIEAKNAYEANLQVLRTSDEMTGALLNTII